MSEKLLVPRIRFKEFTNAWEQWKARGILLPYRQKNDKNLTLISYSVSNKEGFVDQKEFFDEGGKAVYADKKNSLIISFDTFAYNPSRINVGSIALFKNTINGLVSPIYEVFKVSANSNPDFIYLWFKSECFNKIVANNSNKSVRDTLNLKQFEDNLLNLPVLQEQNKIAKLFSSLDSLITLHQRKHSSLKNLKNRLLDKMFCDEKSQFPSIRFKEFTNAWEQEKLGNLTILNRFPQISAQKLWELNQYFGEVFLLPSSDNNNWKCKYSKEIANLINTGEVITIGRARNPNVKYVNGTFISSQNHIIESKTTDTLLNKFLYFFITKVGKKFYGFESTYPMFTKIDFLNTKFSFPIVSEQIKIIKTIDILDSLITLHQRKLNSLKNIKNTLLEKMFV
ncbi:restriction endonuclease subunit S [Mycoplasmopsis agalactiae]|uniref:Type I R/M system specificity subunit n=1 Tax=Mycoplasmopsis agalactiae TaxID=2110 RepID=D3VR93_MYCAA|nr:restriction endonuclease subunit S [Mycoplasmopsis agalactiae]CBH40840.1 Type I R/M system specificity subunit [Mycoplasmopsis agalactiae]